MDEDWDGFVVFEGVEVGEEGFESAGAEVEGFVVGVEAYAAGGEVGEGVVGFGYAECAVRSFFSNIEAACVCLRCIRVRQWRHGKEREDTRQLESKLDCISVHIRKREVYLFFFFADL